MNYSYLTDSGRVRDHNEDNVIIVKNDASEYLLAVADGMGGHLCGEVASSIAIKHVADRFKKISSIGNKQDAENWIQSTVSEVNALIYKYTEEHPESKGMGTTFVCAILTKDFLLYGNIGDSSGFAIKGDKIQKITNDHTLVSLLVKSGDLTEEEAKEHPKKNVLLKALGATTTVDMDIFDVETDIDAILLCSDGMTNMLDNEQILKVIKEDLTTDEKVKKLIDKCNNRGGTDNISVAYLERGVEK
ncbi:MAG: Stp1/IreP family PP2C-type Ser/Thr phosphatase [Bacilli bacterium]|nr:Stp1/IreP family PP2C-type Ser/Thr phosphatase [Bacilli bacterium]